MSSQLLYTSQFGWKLEPAKPGDVGMDLPCYFTEEAFVKTEQNIYRVDINGITSRSEMIDSGFLELNNDTFETCCPTLILPPKAFATLPSGINVKIPEGTWMLITARSSTVFNKSLLVFPGIIDNDYTGELLTRIHNPTRTTQSIRNGTCVSQAIIVPKFQYESSLVDKLPHTSRGMTGFGSSGR